VREACADTLSHLQAAAKDIVDTGYRIRSKDENGEVFIPGYTGDPERDNAAGDLASFVMWDEIIPGGECNAKRASALIGTGTGQGLDCGEGGVNDYERMATTTHYYNYDIVRFFHVAHLAHALVNQDDTAAAALLRGMDARLTEGLDTPDADLPKSRSEWERDLALVALRAAAWGLPLTSREARLIQEHWGRAVDEVTGWAYWDPWAAELPDGELPLRPPDGKEEGGVAVRWASPEDLALLLEYCWSPLKNPAGVVPIDCAVVADPARWGT
jgi:hypothetical protein